jgi:hypothetical protein
MDEKPVAAWTDEVVAPLVETPAGRARRLSTMLYHALVERGMDEAEASWRRRRCSNASRRRREARRACLARGLQDGRGDLRPAEGD